MIIMEKASKAAVENKRNTKEVMILSLKQRGADVVITEEVAKIVAGRFEKDVIKCFCLSNREAI